MNKPRVSVIIPVYNQGQYLGEAIESVAGQTAKPFEIIVVDDGCTDNSAEIARGFESVIVTRQSRQGTASARNRGAGMANGDYLAYLDADDYWCVNKLEVQLECLTADADLDMVFGGVRQFISPELPEPVKQSKKILIEEMVGICASTMLVKRDSFTRVGPFDTSFVRCEFIDWYARARSLGLKESRPEEVVCFRRIHQSNQGTRERESRNEYLHALKKKLDRDRDGGSATGEHGK